MTIAATDTIAARFTNSNGYATLNDPKASKDALRAELTALGSYRGKKVDGISVSRLKVGALRAYSVTVAASVLASFPSDDTTDTVTTDTDTVTTDTVATDAVTTDDDTTPTTDTVTPTTDDTPAPKAKRLTRSDLFAAAMALTVPETDGSLILTTDVLLQAGYSTSYTNKRCAWSPKHSSNVGKAAADAGFRPTTRKDDTQAGGFVVVCTPSTTPFIRPDAKNSASRVAASTAKISARMFKLFGQAIAAKGDTGGDPIVLTADDLVMQGIGATWVTTSNTHLADPTHVIARMFHAMSYTAAAVDGSLVLTSTVDEVSAASA